MGPINCLMQDIFLKISGKFSGLGTFLLGPGPGACNLNERTMAPFSAFHNPQPYRFLLVVHYHRYLAPMAESIPPKSPATIEHERTLFRLFPGYLWSERTKDTCSWVWDFGHDIQKTQGSSVTRRWVCKRCIQQKRTRLAPTNRAASTT